MMENCDKFIHKSYYVEPTRTCYPARGNAIPSLHIYRFGGIKKAAHNPTFPSLKFFNFSIACCRSRSACSHG